jgi:hypothetical protein
MRVLPAMSLLVALGGAACGGRTHDDASGAPPAGPPDSAAGFDATAAPPTGDDAGSSMRSFDAALVMEPAIPECIGSDGGLFEVLCIAGQACSQGSFCVQWIGASGSVSGSSCVPRAQGACSQSATPVCSVCSPEGTLSVCYDPFYGTTNLIRCAAP